MSTTENAYQELARIFRSRDSRILEIEILPPQVGPLFQDGCSIGITKKYLVQAFVTARCIFFKHLGSMPDLNAPGMKCPDAITEDEASIASQIILLFDCEHTTACNWRKRRLDALIKGPDLHSTDVGRESLAHALETERSLMTTYLCSPLHRHTKSPTLWQHRLWILNQMDKFQRPGPTVQLSRTAVPQRQEPNQSMLDTTAKFREMFQAEFAVVLRAGELHPKNYYAFSYMRRLHVALTDTLNESEHRAESSARLALLITEKALDWCLAHPADISGWMFLLYLLETISYRETLLAIINKAVKFGVHVRWEGESLWTFVHLATTRFDVVETVWCQLCGREEATQTRLVAMDTLAHIAKSESKESWKTWMARAKACWSSGELAA
ncbi:uncharacterized protein NFIA_109820 [Aspergillus fischeri NRRL 181]|uniref:Uncharacterized protein n=1 Tax=Neosartorya fischeri (strain ATCC 1020 / DSM 3700 / CBS 544.65 / FGSC A1164 / JCM 1740 / NRRL 181 / WB 181) TaxID=331117 RepID=A1CXY6_NEOFI|nr:conserved hypothetical protein [Aspergillus fischeri NRRL 181]EAW25488.1 conserved hypothetical protein [Aspergillus fischeri NRRL 181]KAG2024471.1 hypothetical protein GB937_003663 [Aspergillus fischeri]